MAEGTTGGAGSHPQPAPGAEMVVTEGSAPPSKNALKKAQKEKEKAEKAAKRAEEEQKKKEASDANDTAKGLYGKFEGGLLPEDEQGTIYELLELNESLVGQSITVEARVTNARIQSAKLGFLNLSEDDENIQAVVAETVLAEDEKGKTAAVSRQMVKWVGSLNRETMVYVMGLLQKPKEPVQSATIQNFEIHVQKCFVVAEPPEQLEIQVNDVDSALPQSNDAGQEEEADETGKPQVGLAKRLDNRILDLRAALNVAIFDVNSEILRLYREFMQENKFREFQTPKMIGAATEGGANVFPITYFEKEAYLAQSPQFYKQMLIAAGRRRVCESGPVFRAENSNTPRHLTEFTGLDFEMRIRRDWKEVVDMVERMVLYIFSRLPERCSRKIEVIKRIYPAAGSFKLPKNGAPRITFAEGVKMLREAGHEASEDEDISTTNEKALGQLILEKYSSDFFIMTEYPVAARPFYTKIKPGNPKVTNSYDAFMRGQEIVSGAQRIHDVAELEQRMRNMVPPLDPEAEGFKHYVQAFRNGCGPHGGAGFGLNRLTMLYLGLQNIRQATAFPRDPGRLFP